jgi:methionyl aminopeptidase
MVHYKSDEEIELIRNGGVILGKTHAELAKVIRPGVKTNLLESIANEFIKDAGARPSFKGYKGFKYALCISVNEVVVHGFPSDYTLKEGDIISIDCGVYSNGFHADSAYTYPVGNISVEKKNLLKRTKEALYLGIDKAVQGGRLGDISHAIQSYVESHKYSVVRELVGHGVGKNLHEKPEVANFGKSGKGQILQRGLVIAIEPMVNMGTKNVVQEKDGWTIRTADRLPSAHFEHTVAIKNGKADILTTFKYIEEVLSNGETSID